LQVLSLRDIPLLEPQTTIVMEGCLHNQLASFAGRYLKHTPNISPNLNLHLVNRIVDHLVAEMRPLYKPEFDFHKYVASKPGSSRRRFLRAYKQLLTGTRDLDKISKITAFIKNERYYEEGKAPRMIMGRDPRFNTFYARHIARLEDAFFQLPQVANKCDFSGCGEKFSKLLGQWMFENDMSKYESSQRYFHLALEYLVYAQLTPHDERDEFATLFAAKMLKSGHTKEGLKFEFEHCRGSGDLDTGLGNGVLNYISTMYFKIMNFCPKRNCCDMNGSCCSYNGFVLKGDDSYGNMPVNANFTNYYSDFGFDAKLIIRHDPRTTEFCSGHFLQLSDGSYYYVQKLRKLITSITTIINPEFIERGWVAHYYRSLGDMYSVLYGELPVYGELAKFLQTASTKFRVNTHLTNESYGHHTAFSEHKRSVQKIDVCHQTLVDVSVNNQIDFAELTALKEYFDNTAIRLPEQYSKRCNVKNKPAQTVPHEVSIGNRSFNRATLPSVCKVWLRSLRHLGNDRKHLGQILKHS
jgi:hypothetical protein